MSGASVATLDALHDALRSRLGDRVSRHAPLGARTTYRVGGRAALLLEADTVDDLLAAAAALAGLEVPVLVVGRGSNLLVADGGFPGLAVVPGDGLAGVHVDGTTVRAGGAASLPVVARRSVAAGLSGFEWAVGVPGSVGGAVRMNAGGHGSDMAASLVGIRAVDLSAGEDGRVIDVPVADLGLGYRCSAVTAATVVVEATLALAPGARSEGERLVAEVVRWRREHQPGGQNAGSVFTNPAGDSAGRLVDAAGLRGVRRGSATVSAKHANFIIADPAGRADDVLALMDEAVAAVEASQGVRLHPETVVVGDRRPRVEVEG